MHFTSDFVSNLFYILIQISKALSVEKKIIFNLSDAFSTKVSTKIFFIAKL